MTVKNVNYHLMYISQIGRSRSFFVIYSNASKLTTAVGDAERKIFNSVSFEQAELSPS